MEGINRFRFTDKSVEKAIKVLKKELPPSKGPAFLKRFKADIVLRNGDLFFKEKKIIREGKVEELVRSLLYDSKSANPWSRDAGYAALAKKYVGISRRKFFSFVGRQRVKRESDNVPPATKKRGKKLKKKGQIEIDLFFISHKDVPSGVKPKLKDPLDKNPQYYVLSMIDKLTSLYFAKYLGASKTRKHVMKAVREGGQFFAKRLGIQVSKLFYWRDAGTEFSPVSELRGVVQKLGPSVEQTNSHAQRILHRLLASARGSLTSVTKQTQAIVNNTKSTISKMTPNEAALKEAEEIAPLYNRARSTGEPDRYKALKVGMKVRVVTKKPKGTFYKAYQKTQYSKTLYKIKKVGKTRPYRYFINGKWYGRDQISGPMQEIDQVSESLIASRRKPKKPEPKIITDRTKKKLKALAAKKIAAEKKQKVDEEKARKKTEFEKLQKEFNTLIGWVEGEEKKDYFAQGTATEKKLSKFYNSQILKGRELAKKMRKLRKKFKNQKYFAGFDI